MIYWLLVAPSDPEADRLEYIVHDLADVCSKRRARHIQQDSLVATSDIESDAAWTDRVSVRDDSADWHRVALVVIRHQSHLIGCLGARLDLTQRAFVWLTPYGNVVD